MSTIQVCKRETRILPSRRHVKRGSLIRMRTSRIDCTQNQFSFSRYSLIVHCNLCKSVCCRRRQMNITIIIMPPMLTFFRVLSSKALTDKSGSNIPDESEQLRNALDLFQTALNATKIEDEEKAWSLIINEYRDTSYSWSKELMSRALGNRGNCLSRQGK